MNDDGILILFTIITSVVVGFIAYDEGRNNTIQNLCEKQQYNFCEVVNTTYRLKGENND